MPDIFLHLDGQQAGPYSTDQVRQFLAEGRVTGETPAWHQGLSGWSTVSVVLAAFPPAGGPPPFVAPPAPVPAKKGLSGCALAAIIVGCLFVLLIGPCMVCVGVALGPITNGIKKAKESVAIQQARQIDLMLYAYSVDHFGAYPDGKTSTEVFQKLLDGKYASDPAVFYVAMPGKIKPTSSSLTPDNVSFDVTSGIGSDSSDGVPVVFLTGYTMSYTSGGSATRIPGQETAFPGIAIAYKNNSARFINSFPDGTVFKAVPETFDPGNKNYVQLRP
jgi:hypothetical protein